MTSDELRARLLMIGLVDRRQSKSPKIKCEWGCRNRRAGGKSMPWVYYYPRGHPDHHLRYSVHLSHKIQRTETNDPEKVWALVQAEILGRANEQE
jgi:hypothetical protein